MLDVDQLLEVVGADELTTPSENIVCEAVMNWIVADVKTRKPFLGKLLATLKLPLTTRDYLLNFSTRFPFLETDENGSKFLAEARRYQMLPARQADLYTSRTKHRRSSGIVDTIVVIADCDRVELFYNVVDARAYSISERIWYDLAPLPNYWGPYAATCTYETNRLFASWGGEAEKQGKPRNKQPCTMASPIRGRLGLN
jgi:hypothetical protein